MSVLNKTEESRNNLMLAPYSGGLVALRRGRQNWPGSKPCTLPPIETTPDGLVSGVMLLGDTRTKFELASKIGEEGVSASVGLAFEHVGTNCSEIVRYFDLPAPVDCGNGQKWRNVVMITLTRAQWGEDVWRAAHPDHVCAPSADDDNADDDCSQYTASSGCSQWSDDDGCSQYSLDLAAGPPSPAPAYRPSPPPNAATGLPPQQPARHVPVPIVPPVAPVSPSTAAGTMDECDDDLPDEPPTDAPPPGDEAPDAPAVPLSALLGALVIGSLLVLLIVVMVTCTDVPVLTLSSLSAVASGRGGVALAAGVAAVTSPEPLCSMRSFGDFVRDQSLAAFGLCLLLAVSVQFAIDSGGLAVAYRAATGSVALLAAASRRLCRAAVAARARVMAVLFMTAIACIAASCLPTTLPGAESAPLPRQLAVKPLAILLRSADSLHVPPEYQWAAQALLRDQYDFFLGSGGGAPPGPGP